MKHERADYDRIQDPAGLIPADEPVFIIRGQDAIGHVAVALWAQYAELNGAKADIVASAKRQVVAMFQWQQTVKCKTPDLPK